MSNIYDLTAEWKQIYDMADDPEMDDESWFGMMDAIESDIETKAENTAKIIKMLEGRREAKKAEAKRIKASADVDDHAIERLKKNLEKAMIETGKTKFKTNLFSFGIQKNPASLKLAEDLDFDEIPAEYIVFGAPSIDKNAVKEAIKNGEEFEWAHMEQSEGLRIR